MGFLAENQKVYIYLVIYTYITKVIKMPELLKKPIIHYPQLDTVLMVEEFIREHSGEFKKRSLWENLPRKMMYQTFCVIFDYLQDSGKIALDREDKIAWIWNPALVKKYLAKPHLAIR